MKRKFFIIFMILFFIISGVIISSAVTKNSEVYFLIRGSASELELWQKAINLFMKENPGIKVRMEHSPYNEYWTKLQTMMVGGAAPDVIFLESTRLTSFHQIRPIITLR